MKGTFEMFFREKIEGAELGKMYCSFFASQGKDAFMEVDERLKSMARAYGGSYPLFSNEMIGKFIILWNVSLWEIVSLSINDKNIHKINAGYHSLLRTGVEAEGQIDLYEKGISSVKNIVVNDKLFSIEGELSHPVMGADGTLSHNEGVVHSLTKHIIDEVLAFTQKDQRFFAANVYANKMMFCYSRSAEMYKDYKVI